MFNLGCDLVLQDKYMDLFPTIITKASTIQVLETGHIGSRSGSLQLVDSKNSGLFGSCFLKLFLLFEFNIIRS